MAASVLPEGGSKNGGRRKVERGRGVEGYLEDSLKKRNSNSCWNPIFLRVSCRIEGIPRGAILRRVSVGHGGGRVAGWFDINI